MSPSDDALDDVERDPVIRSGHIRCIILLLLVGLKFTVKKSKKKSRLYVNHRLEKKKEKGKTSSIDVNLQFADFADAFSQFTKGSGTVVFWFISSLILPL